MAEEENNQPVTQTSGSNSLLHRIKSSVADNVPLIPEAFRNSADVIQWIRRGSPVRAPLVASRNSVIQWIRRGSPVRALLVASRNSVIQWIRRGSSVRALLVIAVRIIQFRDDVIESSFLTV
ncbi:hypothetical protein QL285_041571 [Trifolium repens]|jgi:hypothetical protein|nr:hypothetical protein QL285_041571 [Trifolium repens]